MAYIAEYDMGPPLAGRFIEDLLQCTDLHHKQEPTQITGFMLAFQTEDQGICLRIRTVKARSIWRINSGFSSCMNAPVKRDDGAPLTLN